MSNVVFICDDEILNKREFPRTRARGYKHFRIDESVKSGDGVEIVSDGNTLVLRKKDKPANEDFNEILLLTNEIGMFSNTPSEIGIIFLDAGYALITLHKGAFYMMMNGKLMLPNIDIEENLRGVSAENIHWINLEYLLGYGQYLKDSKGLFMYDFEFRFEISGAVDSFALHLISEEDVDISLGTYTKYLAQQEAKDNLKKIEKMNQLFANNNTDDEDDDIYEEEDEEPDWDEE